MTNTLRCTLGLLVTLGALATTLTFQTSCKPRPPESDTQNINLADPSQKIRNQGSLGSCVSFGFLGLVENHLFQQTGISVDLSERYLLRSVLMENDAWWYLDERSLKAVAAFGVVPEEQYSYSTIAAHRSLIDGSTLIWDTAEGMAFNNVQFSERTVEALKKLKVGSDERRAFLDREEIFGALDRPRNNPNNVVKIPAVAVAIADDSKIPLFEETPCFRRANQPAASSRFIAPTDFATFCVLFDSKKYESIDFAKQLKDREAVFPRIQSVLDLRRVVPFAFMTRKSMTAVWSVEGQLPLAFASEDLPAKYFTKDGGGHAVTIVGYLTAAELANATENTRGYLAGGDFERTDLLHDLSVSSLRYLLLGSKSATREKMNASTAARFEQFEASYRKLRSDRLVLKNEIDDLMQNFYTNKWVGSQVVLPKIDQYRALSKQSSEIDTQKETLARQTLADALPDDFEARMKVWRAAQAIAEADDHQPIFEVITHPTRPGWLAAIVSGHPEWILKEAIDVTPGEDGAARARRRAATGLGKLITKENGIFFIRNSWSEKYGIAGHHLLTFDYYKALGHRAILPR